MVLPAAAVGASGHHHRRSTKCLYPAAICCVVIAYGLAVIAYSTFLLACQPSQPLTPNAVEGGGAPTRIAAAGSEVDSKGETAAKNQTAASLLRLPSQSSSQPPSFLGLSPERCDSAMRGMEFDLIYSRGVWSKGKSLRMPADFYSDARWPPRDELRASSSGPGSDRGAATVSSLAILKETILKFGVKSMIDVSCGDANWIFDSYLTDALPVYIGLDISFGVVQVNRMRFGHHSNKHFHVWDATECPLPKFFNGMSDSGGAALQSVDLVHVRDVIQHMTLDMGMRYMCNVLRSGARVLVTTTFDTGVNRDVREGGFYEANLRMEPFSFPEAEKCVPTHPQHEKDSTCEIGRAHV